MDKFTTVTGNAIPLNRADVDTDQIIPAKYLKRIERTGFGEFAFETWRRDPEFVVNNPEYAGAPVLLAGPNFGCGSSREHAPWALQDMGLKVLIAPSFADIFRNNCAKIGLLTVVLPQDDINHLMARAEEAPSSRLVIDLETQTVSTADGSFVRTFEINSFVRNCLLNGLDDIALTLQNEPDITAFEAGRGNLYPVLSAAG
ncbi:MAG: 3-isopropylmalate dehydratase small subunit [Dehalococcoidia bacterium]|nr:3-isopropylmalate dehydratase small subunit [Dehalococcoidia bacterium]MCB9485061.1 3-isopropylmalate dehydratase small subunit [Thermoflexaceae bacterium]